MRRCETPGAGVKQELIEFPNEGDNLSDQIIEKIQSLKHEKNAIILAHYYQTPEIKQIADAVGDSYALSKTAKESKENLILFCGVKFMAESAKILSPLKKVLLPNADAGCPMANMAVEEKVLEMKARYPDAAVVCYINSPVEVKAVSDVCVTSSNALNIISGLNQKQIIFLPDQNLASYVALQCPGKEIIPYPGYCIVHDRVMPEEIQELKALHKKAPVAAHPECRRGVLDLADFVGSTAGILQYAASSPCPEIIIVTEEGIRYDLEQQSPSKRFYFPGRIPMICENMKKTGIEHVLWVLESEENEIEIDETVRSKAFGCLEAMHRGKR
jgi:quinolinate synthase